MSQNYDEAVQRIANAERSESGVLDLSGLGLSTLPDELWEVTYLRALVLRDNNLSRLPASIERLGALELLDLRDNEFTALPPAKTLTSLRTLDLSGNKLTEISADIGELTQLAFLSLGNNLLTFIPVEVGSLRQLQSLYLHGNRLTDLPGQNPQLPKLDNLDLRNNALSELPDWIGALSSIQKLNLDNNALVTISSKIGDLTNLKILHLRGNLLPVLPEEIGALRSLEELYLDFNQLTKLPATIGKLSKLERLSLQSNRLHELPADVGQLGALRWLFLAGNPMLPEWEDVARLGTRAVVAYCSDFVSREPVWQSKLLVVGEGGVGKTSLLRALRGTGFSVEEDTTHGVELVPLELPHPVRDNTTMTLRCWDFGGQQIYHATHQFFLSDRALFVLVWNARLGYEQGRLFYWLELINARAPNSSVLIVATHVDEREVGLPLADIKARFPKVVDHFNVSNRTLEGIDSLRTALADSAAELPLMGKEWPTAWVHAARQIRSISAKWTTPTVLFNSMNAVPEQGRPVLAQMLHDLGELLYFKENPDLRDVVILDPSWITVHISRALESKDVTANLGVFRRSCMDRVWHDVEEPVRRHFVHLMEAFDLSYRTLEDDDISIIVERLNPDEADYHATWQAADKQEQVTILYRFASPLPPGIPTWFIARQHRFTTGMHWQTGGLFQDRERKHLALLRARPHDREVELCVRGPYPVAFASLLIEAFEAPIRQRYPGLKFVSLVPCPCHGQEGKPCLHKFDLEDLLRRRERPKSRDQIECPKGDEFVSVHQLLWGIKPRQDDLVRKLEKILAAIKDDRCALADAIDAVSGELRSMREILQREFLTLHRFLQDSVDDRCPNTFYVYPDAMQRWPTSIAGTRLKLQLCCQAPGEWHPTAKGGLYDVDEAAVWLTEMKPYLQGLIKVLKFAMPIVGPVSAAFGDSLAEGTKSQLELTKQLLEQLPVYTPGRTSPQQEATASFEPQSVSGAALRFFSRWLKQVDASGAYGDLRYTVTPEGHILWLCSQHADEYRRRQFT